MTNGDKIRSMSDGELADFLDGINFCTKIGKCPDDLSCYVCQVAWLKQEATDA